MVNIQKYRKGIGLASFIKAHAVLASRISVYTPSNRP